MWEWAAAIYAIGAALGAGYAAGYLWKMGEPIDAGAVIVIILATALVWPVALVVDGRDALRRVNWGYKQRGRWSDNDRNWGPFTWTSGSSYRPIGIALTSHKAENEDFEWRGNTLRLSAFGCHLIVSLPGIIQPWRRWVDTSRYEWSKANLSNPWSGYWSVHRREYGFAISNGYLSVHYGRCTEDSDTEQRWGWFLPWRAWRHVRYSIYGLEGEHIWSQFERDRPKGREPGPDGAAIAWRAGGFHDQRDAAEAAAPKVRFEFLDFDKTRIAATTQIVEREWRRGEGRFKWLSWFSPAKVERSLMIQFSEETGRRKGSWKGGTIWHSITMLPGELHEAAFARYCAAHEMTYPAPPLPMRVEGESLVGFRPYDPLPDPQPVPPVAINDGTEQDGTS